MKSVQKCSLFFTVWSMEFSLMGKCHQTKQLAEGMTRLAPSSLKLERGNMFPGLFSSTWSQQLLVMDC